MTDSHPNRTSKPSLVVTTIAQPNKVMESLAVGCLKHGFSFFVIGDVPSPRDYSLVGSEYYSVERQAASGFRLAPLLPLRHYARKNIGYLLAMRERSPLILETDDDNMPLSGFWRPRERYLTAPVLNSWGWTNTYAYFTDTNIWPRGLPLDEIRQTLPPYEALPAGPSDCPIQQGLANGNPDVDAIYRLVFPLPLSFRSDRRVVLGAGSWCPFNSQDTAWFADAFPLLYLPSFCTFRMTDIWRSLIAQRIAWENKWSLLFGPPDVHQERNEHNLLADFADEITGYLNNKRIGHILASLQLSSGVDNIAANLVRCYDALIEFGLVDERERLLLNAWLTDVAMVCAVPQGRKR